MNYLGKQLKSGFSVAFSEESKLNLFRNDGKTSTRVVESVPEWIPGRSLLIDFHAWLRQHHDLEDVFGFFILVRSFVPIEGRIMIGEMYILRDIAESSGRTNRLT